MVEGGRGAGGANDGDEKEGAGAGTSRHVEHHGQSILHLCESLKAAIMRLLHY